jgi:predicted AAA+ superfamily ATPase
MQGIITNIFDDMLRDDERDIELSKMMLYQDVAEDEAVRIAFSLVLKFIGEFDRADAGLPSYVKFQKIMLDYYTGLDQAHAYEQATVWQHYLLELISRSDNAFSIQSERDAVEPHIIELAKHEITMLKQFFLIDWEQITTNLGNAEGADLHSHNIACIIPKEVSLAEFAATNLHLGQGHRLQFIVEALVETDADASINLLRSYYKRYGSGILSGYDAFDWDNMSRANDFRGRLVGVNTYDAVTFADIVGYEHQKKKVQENVAHLMNGLLSSNMLLYGDSGTGKSSTVKAVLNMYKDHGLKLISLTKEQITDLPQIIDLIENRGSKFIIFIDDLSFEENEVSYKTFKSVLEGRIRARSRNMLICVTSNRRNIIKEVWKDRENMDDIHRRDNIQEKRSLADRFGLVVTYSSPDKAEYMSIVMGILEKEGGVDSRNPETSGIWSYITREDAQARALTFERMHGGMSGRAARQFADGLLSEYSESLLS